MNVIKNLLIICVLGAVGYGMYQALQRTNVEPEWPVKPKVDLSGSKSQKSSGGPLALGGNTARPASSSAGLGTGAGAPPLAIPPATTPTSNPPEVFTNTAPATPRSSSAPTGVPTPILPPMPPSGQAAASGQPVPSDVISNMPAPPAGQNPPSEAVHNLTPPPEMTSSGDLAPAATKPAEIPFSTSVPANVGTQPDPAPLNPTEQMIQKQFESFMEKVRKNLDEGKYAETQLVLTTFYGNPDLPANEAKQITNLLDQLAGTVIYSRQHMLEPAYKTQPGDTLEKLGQKFSVPWELLARINCLVPPGPIGAESTAKDQPLPDGMELKVVRGPFNAVVNLEKHELTLMIQDRSAGTVQSRYAGRFPIGIGRDQPKLDGEYTVCAKTLYPAYFGPDGVNINPRDPKNPLGSAWIGLTDRIGIHGTNDPQNIGRDDNRGTICVKDRDLQDLLGILSVGSRVTVVR